MVTSRRSDGNRREALGYNPNRTEDLFALTADGYIIAEDIACQHEYVEQATCPNCGVSYRLKPVATINRSFQGLVEMVSFCGNCGKGTGVIFDISNTVYQSWLAERMGELYSLAYEGAPRVADPRQR